jgi:cyclophilin family peptidyl-prolyl cis-trans isomerase
MGGRPDAVASAFEILARRAGKPGVLSAASLDWLRAAVFAPSLSWPARRAALQALGTSGAVDAAFAARAFGTEDWQVRRIAIATVQGTAGLSNLIDRAMRDPDAHVRFEALRVYIRRLKSGSGCVPIVSAMKDPDPHVALAAIDGLAGCTDPAVAQSLATLAASPGGVNWHRASHALVALARLDPARARDLLPAHAADAAWPVRVYTAAAAGVVGDDERLEALAADAHPNVRGAAIAGLVARAASASPADRDAQRARLSRAVGRALTDRRDPNLIMTAARAVAATGEPSKFKQALLDALDAFDAAGGETTIDARIAIVEALKAAAPGEVPPSPPRPRDPMTPAVQELRNLPSRARIDLARGGVIELELLADEAPATVARFARLARAGYYDGLTFHRVEPNFVVQGGSPWANEYAGAPRFQRDEIGFARHERGAVGISTRGRDTGDAQIFIDLVDLPRLNHNYTVFAWVVSGMDVVDRILEADVIQRVTILK